MVNVERLGKVGERLAKVGERLESGICFDTLMYWKKWETAVPCPTTTLMLIAE